MLLSTSGGTANQFVETDGQIRVLLAEDHALFRQGLRELLDAAGLSVIGEASDGTTAVRLTRELRPDVVVMDLSMPRMDGIDATSEIMKAERPPVVLVLTVSTTNDDVLDAIAAGASGYLLKDAAADEIVNAVRTAKTGTSTLSPQIAGAVVRRVREQSVAHEQPDDLLALSARETEILRLVAHGRDNTEIAQELYLSPSTVKNHVSSILEKLGVESRVQAAVRAARAGII
jgi:DNA-binding NarL/FixJ family response regulator